VADAVLNKEGKLESEEMESLRAHTVLGRRILEPLIDDETVLGVVSWHHERWDGRGYPDGLVGEAAPLAARIAGVCEALDAMTSQRAFRPARPWREAVDEIRAEAGRQFDPRVARALESCAAELRAIYPGR
jgi:HD-GYP domain-containing protein (c-di-GMP phosphodiesterase class II)